LVCYAPKEVDRKKINISKKLRSKRRKPGRKKAVGGRAVRDAWKYGVTMVDLVLVKWKQRTKPGYEGKGVEGNSNFLNFKIKVFK